MEQRRLRLGDIVDDYCPRERRITNHAVVAIIEDAVRQTRCTTCDAEHPYKGAQAPRRRKKDMPFNEQPTPAVVTPPPAEEPAETPPADTEIAPVGALDSTSSQPRDEGPVRRPLIRATLPRPEGQPATRPLPEFTIRQSGGRGGFRNRDPRARGLQPSNNGQRFTRPGKPGRPGGAGGGRFDRPARTPHGRPGHKKRSR